MHKKIALVAVVGLISAGCGRGEMTEGVVGAPRVESVTISPTTLPSTGGQTTVRARISGRNITAYARVERSNFSQQVTLPSIGGGYYQGMTTLPSNLLPHSVSYTVTVYAQNPVGTHTYPAMTVTVLGVGGVVETATVTGRVVDAQTGAGIAGATVSIGGVTGYTDSRGYFSLSGVPVGTQMLSASKSGYISTSISVKVTAPTTSIAQPIALVPEGGGPPPPPSNW